MSSKYLYKSHNAGMEMYYMAKIYNLLKVVSLIIDSPLEYLT